VVSPGLTIVSKHLNFDYTPSLNYYSKGPYSDFLNHAATLGASFGYNDWIFQLAQSYVKSSYPLVETGTQTETETHNTSFDALWNWNEKLFFEFTLAQLFQQALGLQGYRQWSTLDWANYRVTRQLSVGLGVGGGYSDVDIGPGSVFEQVQARLNWHPSTRLSVDLNGGFEIREFLNTPGSGNLLNPIMGASIAYQVFDYTSLFLHANSAVGNSFFAGEITETSGVSGGISQRFLGRLNTSVSVGYTRSDYRSTFVIFNRQFVNLRQDDYSFLSASVGTAFLKKGSITASYTRTQDESSLHGFSYNSDQFTLQLGYRF
jgi:hypothetical protein